MLDSLFTTLEDWTSEVTLNYGIFCLVPILVILVIALWKKDTFLSIILGVLVGLFMIAKFNPLVTIGLFLDVFYTTACDDGNV